jgi:two-component system, NarL family, nitrate/nitrite response regulator NarL
MIRILIVGEIRVYRDGLAHAVGRHPDVLVVGCASSEIEACEVIAALCPDVVLLDMATAGSYRTVAQLRRLAPGARVVALGVANLEGEVMACAEAGVAGYVPREGTLDMLVEAIQSAVRGELSCSPQLAGSMLRRIAALSADRQAGAGKVLTPREMEILSLIDDGCSNKDIAKRLGIELATVKNHVHNLLEKLHVHRRAEAAAHTRGPRHQRQSAG